MLLSCRHVFCGIICLYVCQLAASSREDRSASIAADQNPLANQSQTQVLPQVSQAAVSASLESTDAFTTPTEATI